MTSLLKPAQFFVAAALASAALSAAPVASADPLPGPDPIPVPGVIGSDQNGDCVIGQIMENGACVSAVVSPATGGETRVSAPEIGGAETATTNSYVDPMHTVPNLDGDPCSGQWESVACYAMNFDSAPAVQPRSTLSSSP